MAQDGTERIQSLRRDIKEQEKLLAYEQFDLEEIQQVRHRLRTKHSSLDRLKRLKEAEEKEVEKLRNVYTPKTWPFNWITPDVGEIDDAERKVARLEDQYEEEIARLNEYMSRRPLTWEVSEGYVYYFHSYAEIEEHEHNKRLSVEISLNELKRLKTELKKLEAEPKTEVLPKGDCKTLKARYEKKFLTMADKYSGENCKRNDYYSQCAQQYAECRYDLVSSAFKEGNCTNADYTRCVIRAVENYYDCLSKCNEQWVNRRSIRRFSILKKEKRKCDREANHRITDCQLEHGVQGIIGTGFR